MFGVTGGGRFCVFRAAVSTAGNGNPAMGRFIVRETFTELYVHLVWATWDRLPLISPDIQPRLYAAILAECEGLQCTLMAVGGMADHVHLLVKMPAFVSVSQLVK